MFFTEATKLFALVYNVLVTDFVRGYYVVVDFQQIFKGYFKRYQREKGTNSAIRVCSSEPQSISMSHCDINLAFVKKTLICMAVSLCPTCCTTNK